jgi:hypothetical protein
VTADANLLSIIIKLEKITVQDYLALSHSTGAGSEESSGAGTESEPAPELAPGRSLNAGRARNLGARSSPVQQPHEERAKTLNAAIDKIVSLYKFIFNGVIY